MTTEPQRRALRILATVADPIPPRALARLLWPDSPAWTQRTRMNALGGTMPMNAAQILWRLHRAGLATIDDRDLWTITPAGRREISE